MTNTCLHCQFWIHDRDENSPCGVRIIDGELYHTPKKHDDPTCRGFVHTKAQMPLEGTDVKTFGFPYLSWGYELAKAMADFNESTNDSVGDTLQENDVDLQDEALPLQRFAVWTDKRIYFPAVNGGGVFVDSVARSPF